MILPFLNQINCNDDNVKGYYFYKIASDVNYYTGLIGKFPINCKTIEIVKPHEELISIKKNNCLSRFKNQFIQFNPILLFCENKAILNIIEECNLYTENSDHMKNIFMSEEKQNNFSCDVWKIFDKKLTDNIKAIVNNISTQLFIADGHHRFQAIKDIYLSNKSLNLSILAMLTDVSQIKLHSAYRVIERVEFKVLDNLIPLLKNEFSVRLLQKKPTALRQNQCLMFCLGSWFSIAFENVLLASQYGDFNAGYYQIEKKILSLINQNQKSTVKIKIIKKEKFSFKNNSQLVLFLPDLTLETVIKRANKNLTLPPHVTYFEPKFPDNIFLHTVLDSKECA